MQRSMGPLASSICSSGSSATTASHSSAVIGRCSLSGQCSARVMWTSQPMRVSRRLVECLASDLGCHFTPLTFEFRIRRKAAKSQRFRREERPQLRRKQGRFKTIIETQRPVDSNTLSGTIGALRVLATSRLCVRSFVSAGFFRICAAQVNGVRCHWLCQCDAS